MHVIALIVLLVAAVLAFLDWYAQPRPRRLASVSLALCLFIVGLVLALILTGDPQVTIGD